MFTTRVARPVDELSSTWRVPLWGPEVLIEAGALVAQGPTHAPVPQEKLPHSKSSDAMVVATGGGV
jgi:hypothetical protein